MSRIDVIVSSFYNFETSNEQQAYLDKYGKQMESLSEIFISCFPYNEFSVLLMGYREKNEEKITLKNKTNTRIKLLRNINPSTMIKNGHGNYLPYLLNFTILMVVYNRLLPLIASKKTDDQQYERLTSRNQAVYYEHCSINSLVSMICCLLDAPKTIDCISGWSQI